MIYQRAKHPTCAESYITLRDVRDGNAGEWCVVWRSPYMKAPSFWYFATRADATQAFDQLADDWGAR